MDNGLTLSGLVIGGGILATLLGLLTTWVKTHIDDKRTHHAEEQRLKDFLELWHAEAENYVTRILKDCEPAKLEWGEYRIQMEKEEGREDVFPLLPYKRSGLPDIAPVVSAALRYLPRQAYSSLLFLNGRLMVIDERNAKFSDIFAQLLSTDLTPKTRSKAAKVIEDSLGFVIQVANQAKGFAANEALKRWLHDGEKRNA